MPSLSLESSSIEILKSLTDLLGSSLFPNEMLIGYSELVLNAKYSIGGASTYFGFLNLQLLRALATNRAMSFSLYGAESLPSSHEYAQSKSTCSELAMVAKIANRLTNSANYSHTPQFSSSYFCDGNNWVINHCPDIQSVKLCLNCPNPCSLMTTATKAFSAFPQLCSDTKFCMHSLIVTYQMSHPAPDIERIVFISSDKYSVTVRVITSADAVLRCAAVHEFTQKPPVSTSALWSIGSESRTASKNVLITLSNLAPSSNYRVFCATKSVDENYLSISKVLDKGANAATSCCMLVRIYLLEKQVLSNRIVNQAIKVEFQDQPTYDLQLRVVDKTTTADSGCRVSSALSFPPMDSKSNRLYMNLVCATIAASNSSFRELSVVLSGLSARFFRADFPLGNVVEVVNGADFPPPPVLISAIVNNVASEVTVLFDWPTNLARLPLEFDCSLLFVIPSVGSKTCTWTNAFTVTIRKAFSMFIEVGDTLVLTTLSKQLTARCVGSSSICMLYHPVASSAQVMVQASPFSQGPRVVVSGPSKVSSCDKIGLDMSTTTGNLGKAWKSQDVRITSTSAMADMTVLEVRMKSLLLNISDSNRISVPGSWFTPGASYSVFFRFCNVYDLCGSDTVYFSVVEFAAPAVSILGPSSRVVEVSENVTLYSVISPSCGISSTVLSDKVIVWNVYQGGVLVPRLRSVSKDPLKFLMPHFTLTVGETYNVVLFVTDKPRDSVSTAEVTITVETSPLIAVIAGGSSMDVESYSTLVLDASGSYDSAISPAFRKNDVFIKYKWQCQAVGFNASTTCPFQLKSDSYSYSSQLKIQTPNLSRYSEIVLTLTIYKDDRTGRTSMKLTPQNAAGCKLSIPAGSVLRRVNSDARLTIDAQVQIAMDSIVRWTLISDVNTDIRTMTSSSISQLYTYNTFIPVYPNSLSLGANKLSAGSTYTFQVSCLSALDGLVSAATMVQVVVNNPPSSGIFLVSPKSGRALSDIFEMDAKYWLDEDLPLKYCFGYSNDELGGMVQELRGYRLSSYYHSMLPAVALSSNSSLGCVAIIVDQLNSKTKVSTSVQVAASTGGVDLTTMSSAFSVAARNVDDTIQLIAIYTSTVNEVDCALAPECSSLNRKPCSITDHTCGECTNGYVGDAGDSNSLCFLSSGLSNRRLLSVDMLSCIESSENRSLCDEFSSCLNGHCVERNKTCPNLCSGHGACVYRSVSSGLVVNVCKLSDSTCVAECSCHNNYFGPICIDNVLKHSAKTVLRERLLSALTNLLTVDDADLYSIPNWVRQLYSLTSTAYQLTDSAAELCIVAVDSILDGAKRVAVPFEDVKNLIHVISSFSSVARKVNDSDAELTQSLYTSSMIHAAEVLMVLLSSNLPNGELMQLTSRELRLHFRSFYSWEPISLQDTSVVNKLSGTSLPGHNLQVFLNTNARNVNSIVVGFAVFRAVNFLNVPFNSNPLKANVLQTTDDVLDFDSTDQFVTITVPFNRAINSTLLSSDPVQTVCENKRPRLVNYTCPGGYADQMVNCDGSAYTVWTRCPTAYTDAVCTSIGGEDTCSAFIYDDNAVKCNCSLSLFSLPTPTRRITTESGSNSRSIEVVARTAFHINTFQPIHQGLSNVSSVSFSVGLSTMLSTAGLFLLLALLSFFTANSKSKLHNHEKKNRFQYLFTKGSRIESFQSEESKQTVDLAELIDASLPVVFSRQGFFWILLNEVCLNNRVLGVVQDLIFQKLNMASLQMLFSQLNVFQFSLFVVMSLLYVDTDHQCSNHSDEHTCLVSPSYFDSSRCRCAWDSFENICYINVPISSGLSMITIVAFASLLVIPIIAYADEIIKDYYFVEPSPSNYRLQGPDRVVKRWHIGLSRKRVLDQHSKPHDDVAEPTEAAQIYKSKVASIMNYESLLRAESKVHFRNIVQESTGLVIPLATEYDAFERIRTLLAEQIWFNCTVVGSPINESKQLCASFIKDLMQQDTKNILHSKLMREKRRTDRHYTAFHRYALLLIHVTLFALTTALVAVSTVDFQLLWFQCFLLWLFVQFVLCDTMHVIVIHVMIPLSILRQMTLAKLELLRSFITFRSTTPSSDRAAEDEFGDMQKSVVTKESVDWNTRRRSSLRLVVAEKVASTPFNVDDFYRSYLVFGDFKPFFWSSHRQAITGSVTTTNSNLSDVIASYSCADAIHFRMLSHALDQLFDSDSTDNAAKQRFASRFCSRTMQTLLRMLSNLSFPAQDIVVNYAVSLFVVGLCFTHYVIYLYNPLLLVIVFGIVMVWTAYTIYRFSVVVGGEGTLYDQFDAYLTCRQTHAEALGCSIKAQLGNPLEKVSLYGAEDNHFDEMNAFNIEIVIDSGISGHIDRETECELDVQHSKSGVAVAENYMLRLSRPHHQRAIRRAEQVAHNQSQAQMYAFIADGHYASSSSDSSNSLSSSSDGSGYKSAVDAPAVPLEVWTVTDVVETNNHCISPINAVIGENGFRSASGSDDEDELIKRENVEIMPLPSREILSNIHSGHTPNTIPGIVAPLEQPTHEERIRRTHNDQVERRFSRSVEALLRPASLQSINRNNMFIRNSGFDVTRRRQLLINALDSFLNDASSGDSDSDRSDSDSDSVFS